MCTDASLSRILEWLAKHMLTLPDGRLQLSSAVSTRFLSVENMRNMLHKRDSTNRWFKQQLLIQFETYYNSGNVLLFNRDTSFLVWLQLKSCVSDLMNSMFSERKWKRCLFNNIQLCTYYLKWLNKLNSLFCLIHAFLVIVLSLLMLLITVNVNLPLLLIVIMFWCLDRHVLWIHFGLMVP